ncbi:MAG: Gfo/Idh/MocA family oxidoreductase [Terricaulis sp.]
MDLRVGLVGYGLAGRILHAPLIAATGLAITAIVTSRSAEASADFPEAAIVSTPAALFARDDVDLAVIVTPDHLHVEHVRAALEAGKHVVVDKPFAPTSGEALELIALAKARGRMLTVFHNRRWDADFLTVQKVIGEGALGDVMFFASRWDRYRPAARADWHDDFMLGELYGLGPHLIDQALVLFGTPDWLQADVYNQRGLTKHNDGFELMMGKGKLRISLGVNLLAADEVRSFRVLGTRAAFNKSGLDPQEAVLRARAPLSAAFGVESESQWGRLTDGAGATQVVASERGDWTRFYRGVAGAIEKNQGPPVDPTDAARVIALLEAAMDSAAQGARIDVPDYLARKGFA